MEQNETLSMVTTRSAGIRYGLIGGVIGIVFFLIMSVSGANMTAPYWSWIGYVITGILIFLAQKYYKENTNGFMSYPQGIGIAFWYGLISAVLSSIFMYIYIKFIDSAFLQMIKDKQMEEMEKQNMSEEQIEQAMKIASMFTSAEAMLIFGLVGGIISAVIIGLIVTIFTQKKAPEQSIDRF